MLLIECPWCGERDETEFSCTGEAHITRPLKPEELSDEEWADYLFMRRNPRQLTNTICTYIINPVTLTRLAKICTINLSIDDHNPLISCCHIL